MPAENSLTRRGFMFVLSSPSGAGKTTLSRLLMRNDDNLVMSISSTTRPLRPGEKHGKDYYFIEESEFEKKIEKKFFYEYAEVFSNFYGTPRQKVERSIANGKDVLFDIDWQGTQQLKKIKNSSLQDLLQFPLVTFFIIPPNIQVLKNRLFNRHKGQEKLIEQRMNKFNEEMSHWNEYDYVLVNDDLDDCYNHILAIIDGVKRGEAISQNLKEIKKKNK